jgi:hypothetical protein
MAVNEHHLFKNKTLFNIQLIVESKHAKCLGSQASCIAFGKLACPSVASRNIFKPNSDVYNLLFQIFINFEADSNFSQYLSAILQQSNKMCSASQMVAMEHKPRHKSNSSTFRLIVGFKANATFKTTNEFTNDKCTMNNLQQCQ